MSIGFSLPDGLRELLACDLTLESGVKGAIAELMPVFAANRMPFFPGYTDHGVQHVEAVLGAAWALTTDDAQQYLNAADSATLVLAVALHDIGMFIDRDGFIALVTGASSSQSPKRFATRGWGRPWPDLWKDYVSSLTRMSGRENARLFGSPEPVSAPELTVQAEWSEKHHLAIGDFIRRHHGRLAHEIALWGMPGRANAAPLLGRNPLAEDIRDLAGLVARSHTMSLRPCVEYLADVYAGVKRDPRNVHAVYLMALLRIGDYLQIQSNRAPRQLLALRSLRSPDSTSEWSAHEAIAGVSSSLDDPEAIMVDARPQDVRTYLKLRRLLGSIQSELDHSWAVLGEVYGPVADMRVLQLVLRRVHSNLDDELQFAEHVDFVPVRCAFEAADADLLKLLIGPLYGDDPTIGIRELLQNSLDAVRERRDIDPAMIADGSPDVIVEIDTDANGQHWIIVTDIGVGMTAEIIKDYFLRAGASFRMSSAWRQNHLSAGGTSKVLRSGRFGIGVLAAFLLGKSIVVTTRRIGEARGVQFHADLDSDPIELRRVDDVPVGTRIHIAIDRDVYAKLMGSHQGILPEAVNRWNWYHLADPIVERRIEQRILRRDLISWAPQPGADLPGWFRLTIDRHYDVHWSYEAAGSRLLCNGLRIGERAEVSRRITRDGDIPIFLPSISVFDPDGNFPLRLDRRGLSTPELPFENALLEDVLFDIIAANLAVAFPGSASTSEKHYFFRRHPAFGAVEPSSLWFDTPDGIALSDVRIAQAIGIQSVIVISDTSDRTRLLRAPSRTTALVRRRSGVTKTRATTWIRDLYDNGPWRQPSHSPRGFQLVVGSGFTGDEDVMGRLPQRITRRLRLVHEVSGMRHYATPGVGVFQCDLLPMASMVSNALTSENRYLVAEWVAPPTPSLPGTFISRFWQEVIGTVIPFAGDARSDLRDRLQSRLGAHLAHWDSRARAVAEREL